MSDTPEAQDGQEAAKLISALYTNAAVAIVGFLLFSFRRTKDVDIYSPRTIYADVQPPPLKPGFFSWIKEVLQIPEGVILEQVGLDAVMFLRFMKLAIQLFAFCCAFGLIVLMPLNATGFDPSQVDQVCREIPEGDGSATECEDATPPADISYVSLANVTPFSPHLWGHLIGLWMFSIFGYYLLFKNYREYTALRHAFLADPKPHTHSILVREIPEEHRTTTAVEGFFKNIYPEEFYCATVTYDTGELAKVVGKHEDTQKKLEGAQDALAVKGERPRHKTKICGGEEVDSIDYYTETLQELEATLSEMKNEEPRSNPTAFVTFKSVMAATVARLTFQTADPSIWVAEAAPAPSDVIWSNLKMPGNQRTIRILVVTIFLFALVIFWAIPVLAISALSTLENLAKILPFLEPVLDLSPVVKGIIGGVLPTLALIVFMALLPKILYALAMQTGVAAQSLQQITVVRQYTLFLWFNVFGVVLVGSSVFSALDQLIETPTSIIDLMGTEIPKVSTFFINYMLLQAFSIFPLSLAQVVPLVLSKIKKKFVFKTPRMEKEGMIPQPFDYGIDLPKHLLIFLISFTYATISPLILPFALIYFSIGYLVYRQQLVYVYINKFQTGGLFWPLAFDRLVVSVIVGQLTTMGVFGLKKGALQFALAVPLPFISVGFMKYCRNQFERPSNYIPMDIAAEVKKGSDLPSTVEDAFSGGHDENPIVFDGVYDDPYLAYRTTSPVNDGITVINDIIPPERSGEKSDMGKSLEKVELETEQTA